MTLNYWMMVVERYPNLKEEVGGAILGCEIFSLLDIKLVRWSSASCALASECRPSISQKQINKQIKQSINPHAMPITLFKVITIFCRLTLFYKMFFAFNLNVRNILSD
jgi:hypothetical protein